MMDNVICIYLNSIHNTKILYNMCIVHFILEALIFFAKNTCRLCSFAGIYILQTKQKCKFIRLNIKYIYNYNDDVKGSNTFLNKKKSGFLCIFINVIYIGI